MDAFVCGTMTFPSEFCPRKFVRKKWNSVLYVYTHFMQPDAVDERYENKTIIYIIISIRLNLSSIIYNNNCVEIHVHVPKLSFY